MYRDKTPYSQLKIFYHQDILQRLRERERCWPLYTRIKPTNKCDHNCAYCHYKNAYLDLDNYEPSDEIPRDKMMEIIEDMAELGTRAVTFSGGGEPLLYPFIEEAMERILAKGIGLSVITNGSLLKGRRAELLSRAKWVRISIESIDDAKYCAIRGIKAGAFDRLCDNIRAFSKMKHASCELGVNVVVGQDNHGEVLEMARLMRSLGADHVKFAPLITNDTRAYHEGFKDEVSAKLDEARKELDGDGFKVIDLYTGDFEGSVLFQRQYRECPIKEFTCVIAADQKVYYCHDKAYLSNGAVGSIRDRSFKDLWLSDETTELFRRFDAMRDCAQHCVYDSRNELINAFLSMDLAHVDFI